MSNHRKGYCRDNSILETLEQWKVLDTEQIRLLLFHELAQGRRIAQNRLLRLHQRRRLNRGRDSFDQPYYYYMGKAEGQVTHRLGVNWVRLWLTRNLKTWESLDRFDYEQDYGVLRADGFVATKNKFTGKMAFAFVEFDSHTSGNPFDKVSKYNKLYDKQPTTWWANLTTRFPPIIVVTTSPVREASIRERISKENPIGLEFRVYCLDRIKKECGHDYN